MRLHFGEFCFDGDKRELSERGSVIHLTPKAVDLLRLLLDERPKILRKEYLYQCLWPDTYVEEANLSVHISEHRAALRDDSKEPRFVKTSHRYGYGFIGEVTRDKSISMIRIRAGRREFDLFDGENIVGRDEMRSSASTRLGFRDVMRARQQERHVRSGKARPLVTVTSTVMLCRSPSDARRAV